MLNSHTVAIDHFQATFLEAAPLEARLRVDPADGEARARFDALNDRLRDFNRLHQYPAEWIVDLPAENASGPAGQGKGPQTRVFSPFDPGRC